MVWAVSAEHRVVEEDMVDRAVGRAEVGRVAEVEQVDQREGLVGGWDYCCPFCSSLVG